MRLSKLKAKELEESEFKQSQNRKHGYSMMPARDRGWARLSNGSIFEWNVPRPKFPDTGTWVYPKEVPEGHFLLDGKLFDVDDFRKYERWA